MIPSVVVEESRMIFVSRKMQQRTDHLSALLVPASALLARRHENRVQLDVLHSPARIDALGVIWGRN